MRYGVIHGRQRKKLFRKAKTIEHSKYIILELPVTVEEISKISERRLQRVLEKGIRTLQKAEVNRAVLASTLKNVLDSNIRLNNFRVFDGSLQKFEFLPKMVEFLCAKFELRPPDIKIGIIERKLSRISQNLIEKLCYQSKHMSIFTADIASAKRYAGFLLENFGFMLEIREIDATDCGESDGCDIMVDIDNFRASVPGKLEISEVVISSIDFPNDADMFDVLACLGLSADDVEIEFAENH